MKELAGFGRISLKPGEKKRVSFLLRVSQAAFVDRDMRWKVEKGEIELMVGSSSEDIWLKDSFTVREDGYVDERTRGFYAKCVEG